MPRSGCSGAAERSTAIPKLLTALAVVILAVLAFVAYEHLQPAGESAPGASVPELELAPEPSGEPETLALNTNDVPGAAPRAGNMEATLLRATETTRGRILQLAVQSGGFECPEVVSARSVTGDGSEWRAHCGDTLVYWVEVDEFGQLSADPAPYGDIPLNGLPINIEREGRTLELRQQE